jgi:S1-C subfamily serine protease
MKNLFSISLTLLSLISFGQRNMAISDVMMNTFMIKTKAGTATGFLVERNNEEYFITARHALSKPASNNTTIKLAILYDSLFREFSGIVYLHSDTTIDLAVIKLSKKLQKLKPLATTQEHYIGEECAFFGFPYSSFYTMVEKTYIPFVKRATVSAFNNKILFLDGTNNPGFSGGPVVRLASDKNIKIFAVITAYYPEYRQIEGASKTDVLKYYSNSGIIYTCPIMYVDHILKANNLLP